MSVVGWLRKHKIIGPFKHESEFCEGDCKDRTWCDGPMNDVQRRFREIGAECSARIKEREEGGSELERAMREAGARLVGAYNEYAEALEKQAEEEEKKHEEAKRYGIGVLPQRNG